MAVAARAEAQLRDLYDPLHALTLATRAVSAVAWGMDIWDQAWRMAEIELAPGS